MKGVTPSQAGDCANSASQHSVLQNRLARIFAARRLESARRRQDRRYDSLVNTNNHAYCRSNRSFRIVRHFWNSKSMSSKRAQTKERLALNTRSNPGGISCCRSRNASLRSRLQRTRSTELPTRFETVKPNRVFAAAAGL